MLVLIRALAPFQKPAGCQRPPLFVPVERFSKPPPALFVASPQQLRLPTTTFHIQIRIRIPPVKTAPWLHLFLLSPICLS